MATENKQQKIRIDKAVIIKHVDGYPGFYWSSIGDDFKIMVEESTQLINASDFYQRYRKKDSQSYKDWRRYNTDFIDQLSMWGRAN